ncbi:MAG: D-alanyl-D-alanine carboxypeptidase [Betaproteobacteria bacterium]|nr:D-alanyl-D-alanine carboxypeptidase [Betaproteobacteria bacterium]
MKRLAALLLAAILPLPGFAPLNALAQQITAPPVAARAYHLVDALSGQVLAAVSDDDRFDPASLTKLMTAYIVFGALRDKKLDPNAAVPVSERAWKAEGSRMFIEPRKPVTVAELVKGMIIQSGNDATIALAEAVAGSEDTFAQLMNREAKRLGLTNSNFMNATGLPAKDHYASARDMATLAMALIRDFPADYAAHYSQKEYAYNGIKQANRNRLLWMDTTVDGVKTGFTEAAGYCLVASAKRGDRRLVSVVMGAQSDALRVSENQKLLNFGFLAFDTQRLYKKGDTVGSPEIFKGTRSTIKLGFDRDVWLTLPRERFTGLKAQLETQQPFLAPYSVGQKAGIMKLTRDNVAVAEIPVVALEDVPVAGFLSRGWDTIRLFFR